MIFAAIDADGDKEELEWRMGVEETNNERDFDCETDYMEDLIAMQDQSSIAWTNQVNFIIENGMHVVYVSVVCVYVCMCVSMCVHDLLILTTQVPVLHTHVFSLFLVYHSVTNICK